MMHNRRFIIIGVLVAVLLIITIAIVGNISKDSKMSEGERYLESYDFKVKKLEEITSPLTFTESLEKHVPEWDSSILASLLPSAMQNENIKLEIYEAFDHPLHKAYRKALKKSVDVKVYIYLIVRDGQVTGSYSTVEILSDIPLYGSIYTVDGNALDPSAENQ